jgi:hypothetical protein
MDPSGVACTNCGKNMTTDDLRRTSCVHCGQVLAHHARAAQQVAVVNQIMAQQMGGGFGQPPYQPHPPPPGMAPPGYGPPGAGAPGYGPAGYVAPMMGAPYVAPPYAAQAAFAQANAMNQVGESMQKAAMSVVLISVIIGVVTVVLVLIGIGVALFLGR